MNFWTFLDRNMFRIGVFLVIMAILAVGVLSGSNVTYGPSGCGIGDPCAQCRSLDAGTSLDAGAP